MTGSNRTDLFTTTFKLHTLGFSVIPSGGGDNHKRPLVDWAEYEQRQPTDAEIETWQDKFNPRLWGTVTGAISGVVVIDADTPEARAELEAELGKPHVITPRGGAHWYFQHPGGLVKTIAPLLPGLDVRGDGGFVNIVGTRPDGEYNILTLPALDNLIPWARLPERLRAAMIGSKSTTQETKEQVILEGQRNAHLASLAGTMRRRGMSQSAIEAGLLEVNASQCQPPLPEKEVLAIARSVSRYEPKSADAQVQSDVKLRCMADVKAEAVSWLWKPYIPKGKVTLEEGDPGIGKSWVSLAIATAVSLGKGLPGQEVSKPANMVLASAEDGLGDTIRPRLDNMGADVSRIHAIDGPLTLDDTGFTLLEGYLERLKPSLLIIDPLYAFVGSDVDIHKANETRAVMARLARLAEKHDIAILAVRHLTKGSMSKAIYRGLGSIDITAACRSVLLAGCDPENPQNKALVHIKSNLAPTGPAIGFELREGGFYWTGESTLTAAQILAADSGSGASELDEAIEFLKEELAEGQVPAKDVYRDAEGQGVARRTLQRAKATLNAESIRNGDAWFWCLTTPTSPTSSIGFLGDVGKTRSYQTGTPEKLGDVDQGGDHPHEVKVAILGDVGDVTQGPQGLNSNGTEGLPCIQGAGTCTLRTDSGKFFSCLYEAEGCEFNKRNDGC